MVSPTTYNTTINNSGSIDKTPTVRVKIIGGSGFVGTRLIELLKLSNQYQIENLDTQDSHFFSNITTYCDVRDREQLNQKLKETDIVILLAAQHRDDVTPTSLYYDVNVNGIKNTLQAMEYNGCKRLLFFSSVAIYGLNRENPNEDSPANPFNHYGKSKWEAEKVIREWRALHNDWNINIVRPTVIFGERNRGNVYNLLKQITSGTFLMVGNGRNKKSMAYVGNVVAFVKFLIENRSEGFNIYNYIDKPDYDMNRLVRSVCTTLNKRLPRLHFPFWLGLLGGYVFDLIAFVTRKKLSVSSVRVKKFCATTEFDATKLHDSGFIAPFTLNEGITRTLEFEFVHPKPDKIEFVTE